MSHFLIKRARKIRNKSLNCTQMCLTITKITINTSCSKFSCERPFNVIFVIVIRNWQIWCGFLIVYGLVLQENGTKCRPRSHDYYFNLQKHFGFPLVSFLNYTFRIRNSNKCNFRKMKRTLKLYIISMEIL